MALIHVFKGIGCDEVTHYTFTGSLRKNLPHLDWNHTLILRAGYRISPDYDVQDDDIIFIRMLPADLVTASIVIGAFLLVGAVAGGVTLGTKLYEQHQQLEALQKAQKNAKMRKTETLPFIKGAKNQPATGQTFPYTIGESLFTPYRLCPPYYTIAGEHGQDQYLTLVLECGFNNLLIKKLNLKNTAVKTWQETTPQNGIYDFDSGIYYDARNKIEIRQTGRFAMEDFNKKIVSVLVNKEIPHEHASDDAEENERITKEWQTGIVQELASHPMAVELIVLFQGLRKHDGDGWTKQAVTLQAEWTNEPDNEHPVWHPFDGAFNQNGTASNRFEYNKNRHMRFSVTQTFTASQSYGKKISIRIKRLTPKTEKTSQENVYLFAVQTTCYDPEKSSAAALVAAEPLEAHLRDKCTRIGIRIAANENTHDMLDSFSVIQQGCARTWDKEKKTWTVGKTPTSNLAAWVLEILTSPHHSPSRYADTELDLDSFGAWYEYCDTEDLYADGVLIRSDKKKTTLETLCHNGHAALVYDEKTGRIEVAIDNGRSYSVALLNSENIISIHTSKTFKRKTDGKKVTYVNSKAGYEVDSVTFMRDGSTYDPEKHTISVTALQYITRYEMAYKTVWRKMAEESAQPRTVTVKVGFEGAYYPLFSRVELQHITLPVGLSHGIIKEAVWKRGLLKTLILEQPVSFPASASCGMLIHCVSETAHGICAVRVRGSGITDTVTVETPVRKSADYIPNAGDAYSFGLLDSEGGFSTVSRPMKIVNVEPADYGYTLTLKDYNETLYQYGTLPEYKSSITYIPDGSGKKIKEDAGYVTRDELKSANEQALREAAQEAAEKIARQAAQEAANVIVHGKHFSTVHRIDDMALSLEMLLEKIDSDAKAASDGLSITKDAILLKVEDDNTKMRSFIGITKEQILSQAEDMRKELIAQLKIQASSVQALVAGGGSSGCMSLSVELPVMIDKETRQKLVRASTEKKVSSCYARVAGTDYYGLKGGLTPEVLKPLWEDARKAALLASQFSVEADQIQFKSNNVFVNGKLKADYIDALELAAKKAFADALTVRKLHIDSKEDTHQDFEAWFDETNGLKIKNKGEEIFRVDKLGNIFAKNATITDGYFSGNIVSGPLELLNSEPSTQLINIQSGTTAEAIVKKYGQVDIICENIKNSISVNKFISYALPFTTQIPKYRWDYGGAFPKQVFDGWETVSGTTYTVIIFTDSELKKYIDDEQINMDLSLTSKKGSKTFKLKNVPTVKPIEKNIIWVASDGSLKLS